MNDKKSEKTWKELEETLASEVIKKANRRATFWFLAWTATAGLLVGTMIAFIAVNV